MRVLGRTLLVLFAAALAIAAAYALKPPVSNVRQDAASVAARAQKRPAAPGGQEALTHVIAGIAQGQPDYSRLAPGLADAVRRQEPGVQRRLAKLGALQSVSYVGGINRMDLYRASFARGSSFWGIALDKGIIQGLVFLPPGLPTPQDWIDNYASFPWVERAVRMAEQFGILLAAALFGRLAFRLRL